MTHIMAIVTQGGLGPLSKDHDEVLYIRGHHRNAVGWGSRRSICRLSAGGPPNFSTLSFGPGSNAGADKLAPVKSDRSIPEATVVPVLVYPDVRAAVDWLSRAFGFSERVRIGEAHPILMKPTDFEYGERQYEAADPAGHRWTFSETPADVAPEEWGGTSVTAQPR
jgi:hypothetical protein